MNEKMPALFLGHGSPSYAIEENEFSAAWRQLGESLPRPQAILAVSAHWYTHGTWLCGDAAPKMIYDMYGFPQELYRIVYPAAGAPALAQQAAALTGGRVAPAGSWGLDHGVWSILRRMFPQADIPVVEMSVDADAAPQEHLALGRRLAGLRREGVLLFGSGSVVHNLRRVDWEDAHGKPWADAFDGWVKEKVLSGRYADLADWRGAPGGDKAFETPEHYLPLLTVLGAALPGDTAEAVTDARTLGAISMTGYVLK